jgi:phosphoribosylglycinamide formyltransferase 2
MVTMATQVWSEFALHARAILGLPIPAIRRFAVGGAGEAMKSPAIDGLAEAYAMGDVDVRFFGKPHAVAKRRLGVVLATAQTAELALAKAKTAAGVLRLHDRG